MSESESEGSQAAANEDAMPYPVDNQFRSEKDKKYILGLPEIQREQILAERAHERERALQDLHLRRLLKARENEAKSADQKKRKAGSAELDGSPRKSSRQKTTLGGRKVGETSSALEGYKRKRQEKGLREEQRKRDREERQSQKVFESIEGGSSDIDAEGESEVDWTEEDARERNAEFYREINKAKEPGSLVDFERARVGRQNFADYWAYPNFEQQIIGCYVRVSVGPHPKTGENIYRMAQIKGEGSVPCERLQLTISGWTEGRPYAVEKSNGTMVVTSLYARTSIGKSERTWPFIMCSSSKFTEVC